MDRLAYPLAEAAAQLGIGRSKLYSEIAAGRLRTVAIGRRRLVPRSELERYLAGLPAGHAA